MSFFTDLENALKAEVEKIKPTLESIYQFFKPLVVAGAEEVAQAALGAVLKQAPLVISGEEKLNAATASVISTLGSTGKTVAADIATAAVQAAYSAVSAAVPATPAQSQ